MALCEVPLGNGRRADIMAIDAKGLVTIVEIKVSRADLLGDIKWPEYLDYCDRFYWALPTGFDLSPLEDAAFRPDLAGLIVADRYDAAILREAACRPLASARRKAETLRFAAARGTADDGRARFRPRRRGLRMSPSALDDQLSEAPRPSS